MNIQGEKDEYVLGWNNHIGQRKFVALRRMDKKSDA